jgi:hypothetical protein
MIGVDGLRASPEHDGVSGLEAEAGGVDRHVRTRFVDDADHAQGNPDAPDDQPVRPPPGLHDGADGVREFGDLFQPPGHFLDPLVVQGQPVHHGRRELLLFGGLKVLPVGVFDLVLPADQFAGDLRQEAVLRLGRELGDAERRLAGRLGHGLDFLFER